jgi:hypothetical protein
LLHRVDEVAIQNGHVFVHIWIVLSAFKNLQKVELVGIREVQQVSDCWKIVYHFNIVLIYELKSTSINLS